jgi:hypothetical protein
MGDTENSDGSQYSVGEHNLNLMEEHRNLLHEATVVSKCDVKFLQ